MPEVSGRSGLWRQMGVVGLVRRQSLAVTLISGSGGFLPCGGARDSWGLGELALSLNSFIRSGWRLTVGAFPVDPGSGGGVVLSMYRPTSINA
jgi:hypothetical protein